MPCYCETVMWTNKSINKNTTWHCTGQHCSSMYACTYHLLAGIWSPMHVFEALASSSPLGYLCVKFCFFHGLHCWASPREKKSHTHSLTHPAYLMPGEPKFVLQNIHIRKRNGELLLSKRRPGFQFRRRRDVDREQYRRWPAWTASVTLAHTVWIYITEQSNFYM